MPLVARTIGAAFLGSGPVLLCLSALAWIAVFAVESELRATVCGSLLRLWAAVAAEFSTYVMVAGAWCVLTLAMMAPVLGPPVDHVWRSTPRRHRFGTLLAFLSSYVLVWDVAGAGLIQAALPLVARFTSVYLDAFACVLLLAWQLCPGKQLCLNRCHQVRPLAPFGLKALVDPVLFGLQVGFWCVGSCWALMFAMLIGLLDHWFLMLAASALVFLERQLPTKAISWGAILKP